MNVRLHSHASARLIERGTTEAEVAAAMIGGERFGAKFGRTGFRRNFRYDREWRGKFYRLKQVAAFAIEEQTDQWLVITVIVRYF